MQDAAGKINGKVVYGKRSTVMLQSFQARASRRNRDIRRYMGLSMEQPGDDAWTESDIDRVLCEFSDIKQNVIEGQSIDVFYASDLELRTLNSTEAKSCPVREKAAIFAELDIP